MAFFSENSTMHLEKVRESPGRVVTAGFGIHRMTRLSSKAMYYFG